MTLEAYKKVQTERICTNFSTGYSSAKERKEGLVLNESVLFHF